MLRPVKISQRFLKLALGSTLLAATLAFSGCQTAPASQAARPAEPVPAPAPIPSAAPQWAVDTTVKPAASAASATVVAGALPSYQPREILRGRLRSVGSDTMDRVMQLWEKGFQQSHPQLVVFHEGKGTSTAMPALREGNSDFGPMSRGLKADEVAPFKARFNYEPVLFSVAVDALAVYVHHSNPIAKTGLTLEQVDAIFSSTRKFGGKEDIVRWGQLGLTGEWANAPINVYSRNTASGTYGFFQEHALNKGSFKTTNRELVGSREVVAATGSDPFGIGYSGIAYKTSSVALVPLAKKAGQPLFLPEAVHAYSGEYPLARFLYLVANIVPNQPPTALQREFMSFVYSAEGQALVVQDGFFPLSPELAREQLKKLGQ